MFLRGAKLGAPSALIAEFGCRRQHSCRRRGDQSCRATYTRRTASRPCSYCDVTLLLSAPTVRSTVYPACAEKYSLSCRSSVRLACLRSDVILLSPCCENILNAVGQRNLNLAVQ